MSRVSGPASDAVKLAAERLQAKSERAYRWLATVETYTMGERLVLDMQEALADLLAALAAPTGGREGCGCPCEAYRCDMPGCRCTDHGCKCPCHTVPRRSPEEREEGRG